jgi:XTP/dITP diphosphohydrolase
VRGTGVLEGTIAFAPAGTEGFGFDPVFVPRGETRTVAELGDAWKAEHSHRAAAARSLVDALA